MHMRRRGLILAFCAIPLLSWADDVATPDQPIIALNNALLKIMHAGKKDSFAARAAVLRPVVEKVFDLPQLLRNSVGSLRWPTLPDDQKTALLDLFTQYTVASYVANFDDFNGEKFVITPGSRKVEDDVVVATRIVASNGDITKLDYVMRQADGLWRVVDILFDGSISRVATTRSDFRKLIAPGDASKLVDSLRDKVANLAAGKPT